MAEDPNPADRAFSIVGTDAKESEKCDLFVAAEQGNVELVLSLLNRGADINMTDEYGRTALFTAAEQSNAEVVEVLLSHGADVNVTDRNSQTALLFAAVQGNVEVVRSLLSHGADVNAVINEDGDTALSFAIIERNVEVVQALLSHGADINMTYQNGWTALVSAAMQGNVEVVRALLSHGADVNVAINKDGWTALFFAAANRNADVVETLLSHGADVNMTDEIGYTALYLAAERGNGASVQALLSYGADVNVANANGQTALFVAIDGVIAGMGSRVEVVQAFLNHGADLKVTDSWYGCTALLHAVKKADSKVVQALLSHGADANVVDRSGQTALDIAAEHGNVKVVKALLSHGADVNATSMKGHTALFHGVQGGNVEVVQALLNHGADVNIADCSGEICLFALSWKRPVSHSFHRSYLLVDVTGQSETALMKTNQTMVQNLVAHGADVNAVNHSGNSALFPIVCLIEAGWSAKTIMELLRHLLTCGADFEIKNVAEENVLLYYLSYAIRERLDAEALLNLTVVCQFLVEEINVNVNIRPEGGDTVILLVLELLSHSLWEKLRVIRFGLSAPQPPVVESLFGLLSSVLKRSTCSRSAANVRSDISGDTPLHLWASLPPLQNQAFNQLLEDMAVQLFAFGGEVNSPNRHGATPLHGARTWTAIEVLLDRRAAPNARDQWGNTPLLSSIRNKVLLNEGSSLSPNPENEEGALTFWKKIFGYHFDPFKSNDGGETALGLLLGSAAFHVIRAFLKASAALKLHRHLVDSNGDTPLHVICRDGNEGNFWKLNLIDYLVQSDPSIVNCVSRRGETALHIVCQRKEVGSLSLQVIQRLRAYGAQTDTPDEDGKTCFDLVADKPELATLLEQEVSLFQIEPWLPWASKSEKHRAKLDQVARGQNSQRTGSLCYHTDPIGLGAFGRVHAGINSKDGREVAVKCVERMRMCRPEDRNEVRKLVDLADCEHVVRYLSYHGDKDFLYIVLELMEGTLDELLDERVGEEDLVVLGKQILGGVEFLHQRNLIHRDIKPPNVLYKREPKLCVKLADFGLSGKATKTDASTTYGVMHSKAGTKCWMAPELLKKDAQHSIASDMFACGLLLHYLFSGKKHPFAPEDSADRGIISIESETVTNIEKKKLSVDESLSPEATHLVNSMLHYEKEKRPSAAESLLHPLFWSNDKKVRFLCAVGDTDEFEAVRHSRSALSSAERKLERELGSNFRSTGWDTEIPTLYAKMTSSRKSRSYHTTSAVDLVRFVRNTYAHLPQLSVDMLKEVKEEFVFLKKFPTLLMHVYKSVIDNDWVKSHRTIESAMTEKS